MSDQLKIYLKETVYDAALDRMRYLFGEFPNVVVSFSGGKDSTVILNLALKVAEEMGRLPLKVLFLDQEAEWDCVIDYIRRVMNDPRVESILHDGYTQPIVTIYDETRKKYVIVDGFHRYFTAKSNKDILERNRGMLPVVVLEKDINDRMASTVRHNRARGKHSISGMSSMVFKMLDNGWADEAICNELGMEPEELLKLKHITGFSKLFADTEYKRAWKTKRQIMLEKDVKSDLKQV